MRCLAPLITVFILSAGCGDDEVLPARPDATAQADARASTDANQLPTAAAYALGSDSNGTGILSGIAVPEATITKPLIAGVASDDSVVRAFNGKLYIVNRFGSDNVTIVDPTTPSLVAQISTGSGTNPQDVVVVGNNIYVCPFNAGNIIVLDETAPTATPMTIDISSYDTDGVPNCNSIIESGGKVYATLGLLDSSFVSQGGKVLVINPSNNMVETSFDLTYKNPFGLLIATDAGGAFSGDLLVGTTEDFGTGNGCVERITTGATPASGGCLVTNATLGGFSTTINTQGDSLWVAVSTSFTESKLVKVSATGVLDDTSLTPTTTHHVTDFSVCPTGHLVVNEKNSGTVVLYDASGTNITTPALDIGLPPVYTNGIVCL